MLLPTEEVLRIDDSDDGDHDFEYSDKNTNANLLGPSAQVPQRGRGEQRARNNTTRLDDDRPLTMRRLEESKSERSNDDGGSPVRSQGRLGQEDIIEGPSGALRVPLDDRSNGDSNQFNVGNSAQEDIEWGGTSSPRQSSFKNVAEEESKSEKFNAKSLNKEQSKDSDNIHDMIRQWEDEFRSNSNKDDEEDNNGIRPGESQRSLTPPDPTSEYKPLGFSSVDNDDDQGKAIVENKYHHS